MAKNKLKLNDVSQQDLNRMLSDAWLNVNLRSDQIWNPLLEIPESCIENPHWYISWLMTQPDYFSFVCSEILNIQIYPLQGMILKELWNHKFPMLIGSRGLAKTYSAAVYCLLRMLLLPGRKLIIGGAVFRQSKLVFEYMENIWNNAPILRDICGSNNQGPFHGTDVWTFRIGDSVLKAIPIGHHGDKIRGLRANDLFCDEFSSMNRDIFETVLSGFLTVRSNPIEAMQLAAKIKLQRLLEIEVEEKKDTDLVDNQLIISGTAYYEFNHFYDYWKKWRDIILTRGDKKELTRVLNGPPQKDFDWGQYSILRIPVELVPEGFMDEGQIARSRATMDTGIFSMEFGAVFSKDSNGFFKRSLIENATANSKNSIKLPNGETILFGPNTIGNPRQKYVIAIDPASEQDNFAIVVLELCEDHRRIILCWTTNKSDHRDRLKAGLVKETDFYSFCARKIRELMKVFPCELIAMDSQGGGHAIVEALHDKDKIHTGELPIWPIIDEKPSDTDGEFGLHIVKLVNFADANWTGEANHNLKKDLSDKTLLFPHSDAIDLALESVKRSEGDAIYDTIEDCIYEIEEMKNEMTTIVITKTATGRDRWDTPEIKLPGQKKGRMTKDRYSALLIGNMEGRTIQRAAPMPEYNFEIQWAENNGKSDFHGPAFSGPSWANEALSNLYD